MKTLNRWNGILPGCSGQAGPRRSRPSQAAFTLLEVIIAFTIFFLFAFTVLEMTTQSLAAARAIQTREPDAGLVASMISLTNIIEEGSQSGDFEDLYPGMYPNWHWSTEALEVGSNGLFRVQILVYRPSRRGPAMTAMEMLLFRPMSPPGSASLGGSAF